MAPPVPENQGIASAQEQIEEHQKKIADLRDYIHAARKICPHEYEEADDLYNYHERVAYIRCKLCGDVH